jgi:hypothetical protein
LIPDASNEYTAAIDETLVSLERILLMILVFILYLFSSSSLSRFSGHKFPEIFRNWKILTLGWGIGARVVHTLQRKKSGAFQKK